MQALFKLITLADVTLQNGQVGECLKLLDGYWPRLLTESVPLPLATLPTAKTAAKPDGQPADTDAPAQQTGWMDRMKSLLPERLRF